MSDDPRDSRDPKPPLFLETLLEAAGESLSSAREHPGSPSAAFHAELESLAAAARRRLAEAPDPPESLGELGSLFVDPQRLEEMTRPGPRPEPVADPGALAVAVTAIEQFLGTSARPAPELHSLPGAPGAPEACPVPAATPQKGVRLADLDPEDQARLRREAEEKAAEEVADRLTASLLEIDPATLTASPFLGTGSGAVQGSVDEVAALLRQLVGADVLSQDVSPPQDERVAKLASELMHAAG